MSDKILKHIQYYATVNSARCTRKLRACRTYEARLTLFNNMWCDMMLNTNLHKHADKKPGGRIQIWIDYYDEFIRQISIGRYTLDSLYQKSLTEA